MHIEVVKPERFFSLRLSETEAKKLRGLALYYPVREKERRTRLAVEFAEIINDILASEDIDWPDREDFVVTD